MHIRSAAKNLGNFRGRLMRGNVMEKIKCPHCGSKKGLINNITLTGYDLYTGDGKFEEEIIQDCESKKTMACRECGKRVMSYAEFLRDYFVED